VNSALELHDSTLSALSESDGEVTLALRPGYLHMSEGRPGVDSGTGWHFDLDLRFPSSSVEGRPSRLPLEIADSSLVVAGVTFENHVPFPVPIGAATLTLLLEGGERLVIRGSAIVSVPRREPQYVEEFAGGERG